MTSTICLKIEICKFRKKHKINPWLTAGIKDKLYKTLVQTPKDSINYPALLSNFRVYKNIIMYYAR